MVNTPPKDKRFESGEIVFWCHQHGHEYSVHYGMVDEQYGFDVYVDYLEPKERRRIHFGNVEWRKWEKHKKWHGIETNM